MTFYPGIPDLRLGTHSPQPIAKGGGLGELVYPEYSTQGVILLNMADIIQAKAAFMLHQQFPLRSYRFDFIGFSVRTTGLPIEGTRKPLRPLLEG